MMAGGTPVPADEAHCQSPNFRQSNSVNFMNVRKFGKK